MGQSKKDDLAYKVLKDIKASPDLGLLRCVQCGMCASSCPAARHSEYDPRVVIKRVLDDDKTLLEDKYIWNCFYCYNCHSVCPVGNSVCEVNQILRQMAIDKDTGKKEIESLGIPALNRILVDTVERFQGSERDVIIYSFCVNYPYQLKFLSNLTEEEGVLIDRKLNVALTRARKQMFITGVPELLERNPLYKSLLKLIESF